MFVVFFKNRILKQKNGIGDVFNIGNLVSTTIQKMSPFEIMKCDAFNLLKPQPKLAILAEKLAILAALSEVIAVLCKLFHYVHYEIIIYGSLYSSVAVTILLPLAKWIDSKVEYSKLINSLKENHFDRALFLAFLFGVCTIIGSEKISEFKKKEYGFSMKVRNFLHNFWDNTRIYGNFVKQFEELFGDSSFDIFLQKLDDLNREYLEIHDIHKLIGCFFNDVELWENKKVLQAMRILNYRSSGVKMTSNSEIIQSIDYLLLSYFKYGKSDIMHEVEKIYTIGNGNIISK
jgi:hypothetical protein